MQRKMGINHKIVDWTASEFNLIFSKVIHLPVSHPLGGYLLKLMPMLQLWQDWLLHGGVFFLAGCSSESEIRRSAVSQVWSDSLGLLGKRNQSRVQLRRPSPRQDGDLTVSAAALGWEGEGLCQRGNPCRCCWRSKLVVASSWRGLLSAAIEWPQESAAAASARLFLTLCPVDWTIRPCDFDQLCKKNECNLKLLANWPLVCFVFQ